MMVAATLGDTSNPLHVNFAPEHNTSVARVQSELFRSWWRAADPASVAFRDSSVIMNYGKDPKVYK